MENTAWWIEGALARAKESLTALIVIAGVLWFFGKPLVDNYIEQAIADQGYATKESVLNLSGKTLDNGRTIGEVRDKQIRQDTQLENIEKLSQETRDLLIDLLRQRRQ